MHCVTLHQYWASLMQIGVKKIETRHWRTSYRGPLAIHAAGMLFGYVRESYNESEPVRDSLRQHFGVQNFYEIRRKLPFSAIVCVVDLVDIIESPALLSLDAAVPDRFKSESWHAFGDFTAGRSLWLCDNLRPLREPLRFKARQNIFELNEQTIVEIQKRI